MNNKLQMIMTIEKFIGAGQCQLNNMHLELKPFMILEVIVTDAILALFDPRLSLVLTLLIIRSTYKL